MIRIVRLTGVDDFAGEQAHSACIISVERKYGVSVSPYDEVCLTPLEASLGLPCCYCGFPLDADPDAEDN